MTSSRSLVVLIAATGLLSTGWDPGGGTTNGLKPATYQPNKEALYTFMKGKLTPLTPDVMTWLKGLNAIYTPPQGNTLIQDTIDCALPEGQMFPDPSGTIYSKGLMTGTGWPGEQTNPNTQTLLAQMSDVHTCLITRLNFFGEKVPIFLSGPHVAQKKVLKTATGAYVNPFDDPNSYPYEEAVWLASANSGRVDLEVWPLDGLQKSCALDPAKIALQIKRRVCDSNTVCTKGSGGSFSCGRCGLTVHPPTASPSHGPPQGCTGAKDSGLWTCGSQPRPAIATRLGPCAWKKIYLDGNDLQCGLPPGFPPSDRLASMCADPTHP